MSQPNDPIFSMKNLVLVILAFGLGAGIMAGIGALLINIEERKHEARQNSFMIAEIPDGELDPAVWGKNFPHQFDSFNMTKNDTASTPYGGSIPFSKLERNPRLVRLWAGYAFSKDHNEERGHYFAQTDQAKTQRVKLVKQPGACANCHAAEAPKLIAEMGWEAFNKTPYDDIKDKLHIGTSCSDCHDPKTMNLRLTRPALINALQKQGKDPANLTRQEMRSYVCAQCHVEYYFQGENKLLTFPWDNGLQIDEIESYYDAANFKDWAHKESQAPMIKVQHPEFEMWSTGLHAKSGVSCADCHMPYTRVGAVKVSDHWVRSPLNNLNKACQTCHKADEKTLYERVITIQTRTAALLERAENSIIDAIDAITAAQKAGATDDALQPARLLHRRASIRWDFVSSENSAGFHSPQEAARALAESLDYSRQAQLAAVKATPK